ncbi:hypothetical protein V1505DRAFT_357644 [Lipomyces doorenjongii]
MSSFDEQRELEGRFGTLLSISDQSLVTLASNVRRRLSGGGLTNGQVVSRLNGSYNLVHIVEFDDSVRYVVRVPATGWGSRFTAIAKRSLVSQALTLRLIRKETAVPVPDVYAFDISCTNEIGAPYILMSFINGHTVCSKWFDRTGPTALEDRRLRTLDTLAQAMSQLQKFQFDKIGSLEFDNGTVGNSITIGPCYRWDEGILGDEDYGKDLRVQEFGPFESSKSYLRHWVSHYGDARKQSPLALGSRMILDMMISCLPLSTKSVSTNQESFVLSLPDFDSQNIMIDERGNLTGIIDWDNVQAVPRFIGYLSFPGWITRDWDPIVYYYPANKERENSPEELKRYRRRYNSNMQEILQRKGDARFVNKSHVFEAVAIAATDDVRRLEIARKVVGRVFQVDDDDALELMRDAGCGKLKFTDKMKLRTGLQALLSVPR